jgi:hypothetical protein
MTDVTFPARVVITEEDDLDGLPVITAAVTLSRSSAALPLPTGLQGDQGAPGEPQPPFIKMGALANSGARPAGLTATDRGKWWHRLDNGSMDFWDGAAWVNCANAVGATGVTADANTLTALSVIADEKITAAGLSIEPTNSSDQTIQLTVPAGARGPVGNPGTSGTISTSPDYDSTQGPVKRSMFAYSRTSKRFRPVPPPCGYGPWHWGAADFAADTTGTADSYVVLTASFPALPFSWRPMCHGAIQLYNTGDGAVFAVTRLFNETGVCTSITANFWDTQWDLCELTEHYGNPNSVAISPSSTYAVVPANYPARVLFMVENWGTSGGTIGFRAASAALTVYAMPVSL